MEYQNVIDFIIANGGNVQNISTLGNRAGANPLSISLAENETLFTLTYGSAPTTEIISEELWDSVMNRWDDLFEETPVENTRPAHLTTSNYNVNWAGRENDRITPYLPAIRRHIEERV